MSSTPEQIDYIISTSEQGFYIPHEVLQKLLPSNNKNVAHCMSMYDLDKFRTSKYFIDYVKKHSDLGLTVVQIPQNIYITPGWTLNEKDGIESVNLDWEKYELFQTIETVRSVILNSLLSKNKKLKIILKLVSE